MPRTRWFQFSLRTLFFLCTAAGLLIGWQANRARRQREVVVAVEAGGVAYSHQDTLPGGYSHEPPVVPAWLRRLVGEEYFQELAFVNLRWATISDALLEQVSRGSTIRELMLGNAQFQDEHLRYIARLPDVRWLCFSVGKGEQPPHITAAGIKHLAACQTLESLIFNSESPPSDEGLAYIGQMRNLRELYFDDPLVTDAGLEQLRGLPRLEALSIGNSSITDVGLASLESLPKLRMLFLQQAKITDEGMRHLGRCNSLEEIVLICSGAHSVTDRGLRELKGLKNAKEITICSLPVTDEGIAE